MPLTPDMPEVIDRHERPGKLQPALVEIGGVCVGGTVPGGHREGVLRVLEYRPGRPQAEDTDVYFLARPGIRRRLPCSPTRRRSAARVQDVAAGGVDRREPSSEERNV